MRTTVDMAAVDIAPSVSSVLAAQSISERAMSDKRIVGLARDAIDTLCRLARPIAIMDEIEKGDFRNVYHGEGRNDAETPLGDILQHADTLALFAVTLGEDVSQEIARLFDENEFAPAAMLDAAASEGAETVALTVEKSYRDHLRRTGSLGSSAATMPFSPGYCGWHVSGQRALFDTLRPKEIGITLSDSFLMHPLKSISGVIVAGHKDIFEFEDTFPFCAECETRSCRSRIKAAMEQ